MNTNTIYKFLKKFLIVLKMINQCAMDRSEQKVSRNYQNLRMTSPVKSLVDLCFIIWYTLSMMIKGHLHSGTSASWSSLNIPYNSRSVMYSWINLYFFIFFMRYSIFLSIFRLGVYLFKLQDFARLDSLLRVKLAKLLQ